MLRYNKKIALALIVGVFFTSNGIVAFADNTVADNNTNDYYFNRGNNDLDTKINSLGDTIVQDLPIPVLFGVSQVNLTKNFGDPRDGGARTHEGLDIVAPMGTPVVSPTKAVVTGTGNGTSSGLYVYTMGPGGESFSYMHLSVVAPNIVRGLVLEPGDLIGLVGNTGNAINAGTHLHFEIKKNTFTDPYPRLTKEFTIEEKMAIVTKFLAQLPNSDVVAQSLVSQYSTTFKLAQTKNITLPTQIANLIGIKIAPANPNIVLAPAINSTISKINFSTSLKLGDTGEDVRSLQKFLNKSGYTIASTGGGSPGNETAYFGSLTRAAVIKYQMTNNIYPTIGFFGPITRASVNMSTFNV